MTGTRYAANVPLDEVTHNRELRLVNLFALLIGVIITFVLARRRTAWIWILLIASDPFAFSVDIGGTTLTLAKVVLLISVVTLIAPSKEIAKMRPRELYFLLAAFALFLASMFISDAHAVYFGAALRETLKVALYLAMLCVAYVAYKLDPDEALLRRTLAITTIAVAALALPQIHFGAQEFTIVHGHTFSRIAGPLEGPNQLGAFLGILLPAIFAFVLSRTARWEEIVALVLGAIALIFTFSRGSVLACALGMLIVFILCRRPRMLPATALLLGIMLPILGFIIIDGTFHQLPFLSHILVPHNATDLYNGGLGTRTELWGAALALWHTHPFFGVGPGNYELLVSNFAPGVRTHANNYYLHILAEQGAFGFLTFLLLLGASIVSLVRASRESPPGNTFQIAVLAIVFVLAYHQLVDSLLLYTKIGNIYWAIIGIALASPISFTRATKSPLLEPP